MFSSGVRFDFSLMVCIYVLHLHLREYVYRMYVLLL